LDGILNINKPPGKTSYSIVSAVKRFTGERRVGHAGTLDPEASGVLPVCLGKATRIVEYMMEVHKVYRAIIELGITTDSYDSAGKIIYRADASYITQEAVTKAIDAFRGDIQQIPPMFSALKHRGQPLYDLAREGISIERRSRSVTIYRLELLEFQPQLLTLDIECSKGTYIRSIAHDLGEVLGCGGYLKNLVRSRYGVFKLEEAISLDEHKVDLRNYLYPIDYVLGHIPAITVDHTGEEAIRTGNPPVYENKDTSYKYLRAYNQDGRFLAILARDKEYGVWRPKKVFI
jgi:tRNA pseudouridine55 synthase